MLTLVFHGATVTLAALFVLNQGARAIPDRFTHRSQPRHGRQSTGYHLALMADAERKYL